MSWFDWLKKVVGSKSNTAVRNISSLPGEVDVDLTKEVIDTSGGVLKPNQLRRALRDPRLLPKPKQPTRPNFLQRRTRKKYLTASEAKRLFSESMRTRDRNIRDLLADDEQLVRYGLPVWRTEEDVARALGVSTSQLQHYSIHRQRETTPHYVAFAVPKRSGGVRIIHAPKHRLKALQRKLVELLVNKLPVSPYAHGFISGRSIATNARPHVKQAVVIKLDLKDCFPSIHFGRVRSLLISMGYSFPVATTLSVLMTEAPRQPVEAEGKLYHVPIGPRFCVQGAPTSPGICNAILRRLDFRLAGLAKKHGFQYTRYADDLTFSGDDTAKTKMLVSIISKICREEGFQVNSKKTRVLHRGRRQQVTGVVVNEQLGLSRVERRRLRAAIHQLNTADSTHCRVLTGKLSYLSMLNLEQAAPLKIALEHRLAGR